MNPAKFKAPHIRNEDIEQLASKIRASYPSLRNVPIDVLGFAEFDLKLEFEFAPIDRLNQEAFLRPDRTGIVFNRTSFKDPARQDRVRFSAAHELGHFYLHEDVYGALKFTTVRQWIAFIDALPAVQYYWIETQADEFAGQFLMPSKELSLALDETINDAERQGLFTLGKESILDFCCRAMRHDFGVSFQAMQTRIRKSRFWPHAKLATISN